jgi:hypothetical protein
MKKYLLLLLVATLYCSSGYSHENDKHNSKIAETVFRESLPQERVPKK